MATTLKISPQLLEAARSWLAWETAEKKRLEETGVTVDGLTMFTLEVCRAIVASAEEGERTSLPERGSDDPWPAGDVLTKLADAADCVRLAQPLESPKIPELKTPLEPLRASEISAILNSWVHKPLDGRGMDYRGLCEAVAEAQRKKCQETSMTEDLRPLRVLLGLPEYACPQAIAAEAETLVWRLTHERDQLSRELLGARNGLAATGSSLAEARDELGAARSQVARLERDVERLRGHLCRIAEAAGENKACTTEEASVDAIVTTILTRLPAT